MKTYLKYPLTYFTSRTIAELDEIINSLKTILPKGEIVNLFIEKFNSDSLLKYGIEVSNKLVRDVNSTLKHAIDTEMLIYYIFDKIDLGDEE